MNLSVFIEAIFNFHVIVFTYIYESSAIIISSFFPIWAYVSSLSLLPVLLLKSPRNIISLESHISTFMLFNFVKKSSFTFMVSSSDGAYTPITVSLFCNRSIFSLMMFSSTFSQFVMCFFNLFFTRIDDHAFCSSFFWYAAI